MNFLTRQKLHTQFSVMTAFLTLVVVIVVLLVVRDSNEISDQATKIGDRDIQILNKAHQLKLSVVQVQQWLTDISATRGLDGLNDGFDEAENNAEQVRAIINSLISLDQAHSDQYSSMLPVFEAYYSAGKKMARAYIDQGPAGGNKMMAQFDTAAADMSEQVDGFLAQTIEQTNSSLKLQEALTQSSRLHVIVGGAISLFGILLVYFTMSKALAFLPTVVGELKRIAGGDLSSSITVSRQDELGILLQVISEMQDKLRGMIGEINSSSTTLSKVTQQMNSLAETSGDNFDRQQQETNQVAVSISEMNIVSQDVAKNISECSIATSQVRDENQKCEGTVKQTIDAIGKLSGSLDQASDTVNQLASASNEINTVLDVIQGIAEQTNLLALNAAIEAARAGEQGRGFAVVADEVRSLATRTQESTEEIHAMIERLQKGSKSGVEVMLESREYADLAVKLASEAGEFIADISGHIALIDDKNLQVANAAEEQSAVSKEVHRKIDAVNQISSENAQGMHDTIDVNHEVNNLAIKLEDLVRQFRVS